MFLLAITTVTASWQRRDYYNDNACAADSQLNIQVFIPNVVCQRVNVPAEICEIKSTNPVYLSSEGTGCDNAPVSDRPYYPSRIIPNTNYLTTNQYFHIRGGTGCEITPNTQITQNTYAADGRCHVFERDTSFRATCDQNGAVLTQCWDVNCTNCDAPIPITTGCTENGLQGQPTRFICNTPEMIQRQLGPTTTAAAAPSGTGVAPSASNTPVQGKPNSDKGVAGSIAVGLLSVAGLVL